MKLPQLGMSFQRVSLPYISNLLVLLFSNGWYHENLASRQLICVICEKYRKSPVLIAGTLYLKILSGAPKKLIAGQGVRQLKIFISRLGGEHWSIIEPLKG